MGLNPYAPPVEASELQLPQFDYFVDGKYLVVRNGTRLPDRCVFTNRPAGPQDRKPRTFQWAPSFRLVLSHRRFKISYCVKRKQNRELILAIWILLAVAICVAAFALFNAAIFWILFILSWPLSWFSPNRGIKVVKCVDGHYWLQGMGTEFLQSIQAEQATLDAGSGL